MSTLKASVGKSEYRKSKKESRDAQRKSRVESAALSLALGSWSCRMWIVYSQYESTISRRTRRMGGSRHLVACGEPSGGGAGHGQLMRLADLAGGKRSVYRNQGPKGPLGISGLSRSRAPRDFCRALSVFRFCGMSFVWRPCIPQSMRPRPSSRAPCHNGLTIAWAAGANPIHLRRRLLLLHHRRHPIPSGGARPCPATRWCERRSEA